MNLQNVIDYCELNELPSPFTGCSVPAPLNIDTTISAIMVRCGLLTPVYGEPEVFSQMTRLWFEKMQWTFNHLVKIIEADYEVVDNVFEEKTEKTTYNSHDTHTGGYKDTGSGKDTVKDSGKDTAKDSGKDTEALSGKDTEALSGTDTEAHSGTDQRDIQNSGTDTTTNTISAYNSSTYQPDNKTDFLNGKKIDDDLTHGESIGTTYGKQSDITYGKQSDTTYGKQTDTTYGKQTDTTYGKSVTRSYENDKMSKGGYDEFYSYRHGNIGVTSAQELIERELELLRHFDIYGYIAELFERDNMIFVY